MGAFASIYHPVGIPMLVQNARKPGFTIGVNGLAGNLGIAVAAVLTGFLVKMFGWRAAFAVPAGIALLCGVLFATLVPREDAPPARKPKKLVALPQAVIVRAFLVMTLAAITGALLFNFTTNGNGQLLTERLRGTVDNPVAVGALLAAVYTVASFAQLVVGKLLDRFPLKRIWLPMSAANVPSSSSPPTPAAGRSTLCSSASWCSFSAPSRSSMRSSCNTSTTGCARAWREPGSPCRSASARSPCTCSAPP